MKMTIESTTKIVRVNGVPARVWQGMSERGVRVTALITSIAADSTQDQAEFDADLTEHAEPTPDVEFWPPLMLVDHEPRHVRAVGE